VKNLLKKIVDIKKQAGFVQKTGRNEQGRYNYLEHAELIKTLNPLLNEAGIHFFFDVETIKRDGSLTEVVGTAVYTDLDTGEQIRQRMTGQGHDLYDKGSPKAITSAEKYALRSMFLIPTGDDPENDQKLTGKEVAAVVSNDQKTQSQMVASGKPFPQLSEEEILKREKVREQEELKKQNPPTKEVVANAVPVKSVDKTTGAILLEPDRDKPSNVVQMPKQEEDNLDMSHPDDWRNAVVIIKGAKTAGKKLGELSQETIEMMYKRWKPDSSKEEVAFYKHVKSAADFYKVVKNEDPEIYKEHDALARKLKANGIDTEEFMKLASDPAFGIETTGKAFPDLDVKKIVMITTNFNSVLLAKRLSEKSISITDFMAVSLDESCGWFDGVKTLIMASPVALGNMMENFESVLKECWEVIPTLKK
jgi:hypothetical protein